MVRCNRCQVPAVVAPDHHVVGVRIKRRSARRLEEAEARRVFGGIHEVEQLRARLPARFGVHGHGHGRRTAGYLGIAVRAGGAFDVDSDALQLVAGRVGTGPEALREHLRVGAAKRNVAVVCPPKVRRHRVERLAEDCDIRRVGICSVPKL